MLNQPIKMLIPLLFLSIVFSCRNENTNKNSLKKVEKQIQKTIEVPNLKKSNALKESLFYDILLISLKGYKINKNPTNYQNIKVFDKKIYILDDYNSEFYCYDLEGNLFYKLDIGKIKSKLPTKQFYHVNNFYINNKGNVNFIDREQRLILTFSNKELQQIRQYNFWAKEAETTSNGTVVFYQGPVNDYFGPPSYFVIADKSLDIKEKLLPVSLIELDVSSKIGTVQHHIFKTGDNINMLTDQNYHIYRYPNLKTPYYKVNFFEYNINQLEAKSIAYPSPSYYKYAKINTFIETDKNILISYFFASAPKYLIYNKNSRKIINRFRLTSIDDIILSNVYGTNDNYFYSSIEPDNISEILKLNADERGMLKNNLKENTNPEDPILVMFKIKDF
jgi:hypothetical protein